MSDGGNEHLVLVELTNRNVTLPYINPTCDHSQIDNEAKESNLGAYFILAIKSSLGMPFQRLTLVTMSLRAPLAMGLLRVPNGDWLFDFAEVDRHSLFDVLAKLVKSASLGKYICVDPAGTP